MLCSRCFQDEGLRIDAAQFGVLDPSLCPNCGSRSGAKLNVELVAALARRFFVWGTLHRSDYGAAPLVKFNEHQTTSIKAGPALENDLRLIEKAIGVGFFRYGPRLWMIGEVEPLKALQISRTRPAIINRILTEYPTVTLPETEVFYRLRKNPRNPSDVGEYDAPPACYAGSNRLDSADLPVMYGSQDLQICIHECRVTAEDELYVATLTPNRELRLLDLTELLAEEHVSEFESLDMSVHMLFLAGEYSYEITRDLSRTALSAGYDGLIYPSYFGLWHNAI